MFRTNYKKQVDEIMQIIQEEYQRHHEMANIFGDAANGCQNRENKDRNMDLMNEEFMMMRVCGRLLDKINDRVLKE